MGKGGTKSSAQWFKQRQDGRIGCTDCGEVATRWIDMQRHGMRRFLSMAYCAEHGDYHFQDPDHIHRARAIKEN